MSVEVVAKVWRGGLASVRRTPQAAAEVRAVGQATARGGWQQWL